MTDAAVSDGSSLESRYGLPPAEIERRSLAIIENRLRDRFAREPERSVACRILYAAGDPDLATSLHISPTAVTAGVEAMQQGAAIVADVRMVVAGIDQTRATELGCAINCAIDDPAVAQRARSDNTTRAAESLRELAPILNDGVAVIGNAPTALLSLLDLVDAGAVRPRLIIGMPVGLVAAAEAKAELIKRDVPCITIEGTRGGSALAAAALNAILRLALPDAGGQGNRSQTAVLIAGHGSRAPGAAEAMLAAVEHMRGRGLFPIVEVGYLEMVQPDLPAALRRCVEQGASRVLVVPYFLHFGMHIRRDIPNVLGREAASYPGLSVSMGRPIGLHADLANVMIAGAIEAEGMPDIREGAEANLGAQVPAESGDE
jgi:precorrin-8X/cobalt-precorrin-8 methylmutase